MYKFFQKTIQVLSIFVLIGTAIFLFWLYKIGILNDQNALSNLLQNQGVYGSLTFIGLQITQVVFPIIPGGVTTVVGFLVFKFW
ncbi:TPA: TVP38/TMEM64 family protein, partial [Streptococcus suis]